MLGAVSCLISTGFSILCAAAAYHNAAACDQVSALHIFGQFLCVDMSALFGGAARPRAAGASDLSESAGAAAGAWPARDEAVLRV